MTEVESAPAAGWRRWVAIVTVLAVAAAVGWFGWWLRHPDDLGWGGYGLHIDQDDLAVGESVWTPLSSPAHEPGARRVLTFGEIRPELTHGTADVDYFVCTLDPQVLEADRVDGLGFGGGDRSTRRYCPRLRPAEGEAMDLVANPLQELVVRVTPTGPGRVVIASHRVEFREGWQRGTEQLASEIRLRPGG